MTATSTDQVAALYAAGAGTVNQASHAAREDFAAVPVDRDQLAQRLDALDELASSLIAAVATLRDGAEDVAPEHGDRLQAATSAAWTVGTELRTVGRLLAGSTSVDLGDDE